MAKSAKILLDNNIYSKSFLMSYLGLEELGKRLAICDYINDIISDEEFKKIFRDHELKMAYLNNKCLLRKRENGIFPGYDTTIVYDVNKYRDYFIERQKATYVDFDFKNNNILKPSAEITKEYAEEIYNYLIKKIKDTNFYEEINERIGTKAFLK